MSFGRLQEGFAAIVALSLSTLKTVAHRTLMYLRPAKMNVRVMDLPVEVIANIFTFLSAEDHASMSEVCHLFNDASKIEFIWNERCRREFKINVIGHDFSCKDLYTKLLYKFGTVRGLWQPEISSYGGLLQVEFENGALVGSELFPPLSSNIKLPLRKKKRFIVQLNQEQEEIEAFCVGFDTNSHKGEIMKLGKNAFSFQCQDKDAHAGNHQGILQWLKEESLSSYDSSFPQTQELLLMKYLVMCQYNYSYKYNRVFLPKKCPKVPIQPGLFKGTYGAHGLELIMLDYDEGGSVAKAVKVSGDPNVPAGKVTFMAELKYSMVFSIEDQVSINNLETLDPVKAKFKGEPLEPQPFRVPPDCLERFREVPRICTGRFPATGQIAGHGFTNSSFSNGHWIIFDEDLFGFLWLELRSLSMYHRVKENLIQ